ncbi:ATP-dependent rRNA helicase rrp3 [Peziza echinospora]|nr:ATP-dependent rRNA helicase rrp3 [Peziza echinospora]
MPEDEEEVPKTFKELGIMDSLIEACTALNYKSPTPIQAESIPLALQGRDLIALAETGSGKTAAFAIPILQALWENPRPLFACILAPTRELAFQIAEAFDALGGQIGVKTAVIVGGMDMTTQAISLGKRPHIVVATPGRLIDHLENTKGFSLRSIQFLVMDEADKLLDLDFGPSIDKILKVIPKERKTYLFSATMTTKVEKLQRASLNNPVRVTVSSKYQTVKTLLQYYMLFPFKHKDTYLVYLVNEFAGQSIIIFTRTVNETSRIAILLRCLGFAAVPLHGQLSQSARLGALTKFKSGSRNILVATDVAARGLDIPSVDCVLNYDLAQDSKTYIHRVGRTARAGKAGKSISLTTQYDVELLVRIEAALGKKLDVYPTEKEDVLLLSERVGEAQREAIRQMKEEGEGKGGRRGGRNGGIGSGGRSTRGRGGARGGKSRGGDNDREEQ